MGKSFQIKLILILFVAALTFVVIVPTTTRACACGMLVPEANQQIAMSGEQGVVVFDGLKHSEQMAIDFQFDGTSSSTALVVPTPVKPDISQIKQVVFDDLAELVGPTEGPVMSNSIQGSASDNSVQVLERKTVGNFEIAVLKTNSYKDLFDWTKSNGFYLEAEAENPVRTYIENGFVLNVIKLKKDANTSDINPLKFTFSTKTIFYPLMEVKDSRDNQKDKSLKLYLLTDGKITDPSIISDYNAEIVNEEFSANTLGQTITKTSESNFSNLNFTARKYFMTYINTFDYSTDASLTLGLGNPSAKKYKPLGLNYSKPVTNIVPRWAYPIAIAAFLVIPLTFFFVSKQNASVKKVEPKIATLPIDPLDDKVDGHMPDNPEVK
ncbi:MAG: DUF2330 domain-containing protein [Candidatus Saccharibacteria bacterium]|nr:DUF2330 domain-containing protein [Candidatus Saccharibacteria bacterium]